MPIYNDESVLEQSINSVVKQTLKGIELICINDGSTDGSLNVLNEFADKYDFINVITQENKGSGKTRNYAMDIAKGDYIGFLDADDYLIDDDALERLYDTARLKDAAMVTGNVLHDVDNPAEFSPFRHLEYFTEDKVILPEEYGLPFSFYKSIYNTTFLRENKIYFPDLLRGKGSVFLAEILTKVDKIYAVATDVYAHAFYDAIDGPNTYSELHDHILHYKIVFDYFDEPKFKKTVSDFKKAFIWFLDQLDEKDLKTSLEIINEVFDDDSKILLEVNNHFHKNKINNIKNSNNKTDTPSEKSIKDKIFNKLLNKSNSYLFYKENYESLKIKEKTKQKQIDLLNNDLEKKNELISDYDRSIKDYTKLIEVFEKKFINHHLNLYKENINELNIAYILIGFPIHSETFVVNEIRWLKENGFNIFVFTRYDPYKTVDIDFEVTIERYNNILELEALLINYDIDLMHTHFVYPICTNFTYPVSEKLRIPFTVFAHAFDIFVKENDDLNDIEEISKSKYCLGIFTLSEFHKNYLLERNVVSDKIIITKQATNYEIVPIKEKHNKIKKIVSISRFVEKKGLDDLISAAKLLENEDFEFSIYGFGDLEKDLQKQIDTLECNNIHIKGELLPEKVQDILLDSDLLVSPCKVAKNGDMDGFPTVIFEAMAVGLPVLTTHVSSIPEIIEDGINGFMTDPNNPEGIAKKIKEINEISNGDLLKIRKQAQDDVKNISSVEKTMHKYLDIIKNKL